MTEYFKVLDPAEYKQLTDGISLITVLIAGADGQIDEDETKWAEKITKIRGYALPEQLNEFYNDVGVDFQERLDYYVQKHSGTHAEIMQSVSDDLAKLNPVLAKLNPVLGATLYTSYTSFAKHVAKASGGFLGFFSVGPEEAKWLTLPMITPIEMPEEEEES